MGLVWGTYWIRNHIHVVAAIGSPQIITAKLDNLFFLFFCTISFPELFYTNKLKKTLATNFCGSSCFSNMLHKNLSLLLEQFLCNRSSRKLEKKNLTRFVLNSLIYGRFLDIENLRTLN